MIDETHDLVLTKLSERRLQDKVILKNRDGLLASVNNRSLNVSGWVIDPAVDDFGNERKWKLFNELEHANATYRYEVYLRVRYTSNQDKEPQKSIFQAICRSIFTKSAQPPLGRWTLSSVDGEEYVPPDENNIPIAADFIGYTELTIPDEFEQNFAHLFGLDSHVARIRGAIEAGQLSSWNHRFHCALIGPPGCGKSDICQTIKRALGEEAVLEFDATATTAAGAIKELAEREILPRVLLVEEIEKADEKALSFLLAVLDLRSEIRKTTARATIQRDTKLFCIATVNNVELFKKLQAGALASRFANKIFFQRPNRDQLEMILQREVAKVDGDFAWISPALDYCDEQVITDPREVTSICLCGRDQLITGEYQKMLAETAEGPLMSDGGFSDWTS